MVIKVGGVTVKIIGPPPSIRVSRDKTEYGSACMPSIALSASNTVVLAENVTTKSTITLPQETLVMVAVAPGNCWSR